MTIFITLEKKFLPFLELRKWKYFYLLDFVGFLWKKNGVQMCFRAGWTANLQSLLSSYLFALSRWVTELFDYGI